MKIAFITAGAAGMFCGSCMRDNTLAAALNKLGHEALLIPTYTPIRTDETDVSQHRVFFGGINVYLQQKSRFFRHTPWLLDRLLDFPRLLRWVSRFARRAKYSELGELAVSMLQGTHGKQRKEVAKLTRWLQDEVKPEIVLLTNALLSGVVPDIRKHLGVPVIITLQGDDIFLDALPTKDRQRCMELIRENDRFVDAYISTSFSYANHMAEALGLSRDRIHVVHPGIHLKANLEEPAIRIAPPYTIGYFARVCPEKGFHHAIDAFLHLRGTPNAPHCKLKVSGWLGEQHRPFYDEQVKKIEAAGLLADFEHTDCPDHASKMAFMQSLDVMTVPTDYHEPKGLYVLEAWENGIPVVVPAHGTFPELIEATGAGVLVTPGNTPALAATLRELLEDHPRRAAMAHAGIRAVRERFSAATMATETLRVLERFTHPLAPSSTA